MSCKALCGVAVLNKSLVVYLVVTGTLSPLPSPDTPPYDSTANHIFLVVSMRDVPLLHRFSLSHLHCERTSSAVCVPSTHAKSASSLWDVKVYYLENGLHRCLRLLPSRAALAVHGLLLIDEELNGLLCEGQETCIEVARKGSSFVGFGSWNGCGA